MQSAIAHAQRVTAAAFAKGTVPAPYYLHLLMRAQAANMPRANVSGCAGMAGGTVYVQRYTAQAKGPTATRRAESQVLVQLRPRRFTGGYTIRPWAKVTVQKQVTVVP